LIQLFKKIIYYLNTITVNLVLIGVGIAIVLIIIIIIIVVVVVVKKNNNNNNNNENEADVATSLSSTPINHSNYGIVPSANPDMAYNMSSFSALQ
jgi:Na+-transporting methylmalonyl-CoA/oxaloacetate decarboxylase gamma subunit